MPYLLPALAQLPVIVLSRAGQQVPYRRCDQATGSVRLLVHFRADRPASLNAGPSSCLGDGPTESGLVVRDVKEHGRTALVRAGDERPRSVGGRPA